MPTKALKACQYPGCPRLSDKRYCEEHRKQITAETQKRYDTTDRNQEMRRFYSSHAWRKVRERKLGLNPLCERCHERERGTTAVIVDHIRPAKIYPDERLDMGNLMSLCRACHNRKTKEDASKEWEAPKRQEKRYFC